MRARAARIIKRYFISSPVEFRLVLVSAEPTSRREKQTQARGGGTGGRSFRPDKAAAGAATYSPLPCRKIVLHPEETNSERARPHAPQHCCCIFAGCWWQWPDPLAEWLQQLVWCAAAAISARNGMLSAKSESETIAKKQRGKILVTDQNYFLAEPRSTRRSFACVRQRCGHPRAKVFRGNDAGKLGRNIQRRLLRTGGKQGRHE